MKILRIIASMDPANGGPCQGIRNFIPELEKLGVENEVVSLDSPSAMFLGTDKFPIHALGPAHTPWAFNASLIDWLCENLKRFDAVVVHGLWLYHGFAARKALLQLKRKNPSRKSGKVPKLFVMPHGMLDPYFQKTPSRKLKAIRNWFYWKLIERKVVRDADGILYTCEEELRLGGQTFSPYRPKREINVGYGIAEPSPYTQIMTNAFQSKCPQLNNHSYFLFLSRIHEKKGLDLLVGAYEQIVKESFGGNDIPKLVIAGPGLDSAYGRKIQDLVLDSAVLSQHIFFTGMLSGSAKWGAFYGCEAFILPSHQENFGIAVVEAMACGKPVLISKQVNIWREIEEEKSGIVRDDNLLGTYQMINSWLNFPEEKKSSMGRSAKQCFKGKFDIGVNAERYLNAIKSIV